MPSCMWCKGAAQSTGHLHAYWDKERGGIYVRKLRSWKGGTIESMKVSHCVVAKQHMHMHIPQQFGGTPRYDVVCPAPIHTQVGLLTS